MDGRANEKTCWSTTRGCYISCVGVVSVGRKQKATRYEIIFPFDENAVYSEKEKKKSWENIFDIDCSFDGEKHPTLSTQATIWEVKSEWVKKAEHFKSR